MAVSEVKLIQVPGALPAGGAPHPAVVALQVFLPLPLLLGLFRSLHLGEGRRAGWEEGMSRGWGAGGQVLGRGGQEPALTPVTCRALAEGSTPRTDSLVLQMRKLRLG